VLHWYLNQVRRLPRLRGHEFSCGYDDFGRAGFLRSIFYFDGTSMIRPTLVLCAWIAIGAVLIAVPRTAAPG
jgi:hypothetical protein